ncbi:hypothetical protein BDM02DRAFT_3272893 [Thelephora ganbajun]|uniref:Uncharacterized protein n=1 Tax=Thelephora ganbajun TaxID=370292 RepID=A0ACB6Z332_THEGA|nr:hypothetical protein BDM02DRAFT_3272893 [Thelephora ganbajun]
MDEKTGDAVGIINDFDLATWVDHSTTNNDRTGTIPFMAIDLLDGGLDSRVPRLYRHDVESFVWVLAFITVASIEYKDGTIKISPLPGVDAWFEDKLQSHRDAHILSKQLFHKKYGHNPQVSDGYYGYFSVVQRSTRYWSKFHQVKGIPKPRQRGVSKPVQEEPVSIKPEVDDPADSLRLFITGMEKSLVERAVEGFEAVKALLLEAIGTPTVTAKAV